MKCVPGNEVWKWHATHGFPLEMSLPLLAERGYVPTWDTLWEGAMKDGANPQTLLRRLQAAAMDAYGREVGQLISDRLPLLVSALHRSDDASAER
jgi:hypothetical protein